MVSRVGDKLWLTDAQAGSLADARSEVARAFAGKARVINELVAGVSMVSGEPAVVPLNPQGLIGLDMSGPPWGSAWRHPVCWFGGRGTDTSGIQAPSRHIWMVHTAGQPPKMRGPFRAWIRPFEVLPSPYVAPYAALRAYLRARVRSGTATLTVTIAAASSRAMTDARTVTATAALTTTMANIQLADMGLVDGGGARWLTITISTSAGTAEVESGNLGVLNKRGT